VPHPTFCSTPARPFGIDDFTLLGRYGDRELAYGLAGRFWRVDHGLQSISGAAAFDQLQALPKLVLNFFVEPLPSGEHRLSATTRVWCPDAASRRSFAPCWTLVRPVSGWIRKRLLKRILRRSLEV
jgi:hypothetical protein